jgi:mitogen-activated protein kinase kinase
MVLGDIDQYPYPPKTYSNIFTQLDAIIHGKSPSLPQDLYLDMAIDFVNQCLIQNPKECPSSSSLP